ncbi:CbiX/SirB N-terminal domain-containing protein, partial [Kitasatospora sp. LaBMicrA B282]|uniref:CbiX/SirB N-terminal domain-containing protein n=1 Tax=Kitasatospora sp. LaBMicrA B282 TaxID=3420949 RepID=UPI003D11FE09
LAAALADRLAEAGARGDEPVVLAAAGSRDPGANADTVRMAALLGARLRRPVTPSYLCAGSPAPDRAVEELRAAGHRRVAVAGYLLAPGFFADRARRSGADLVGAPLGAHPAVAELVLERYDQAFSEGRPATGSRIATHSK